MPDKNYVLTLSCEDKPGIVASVTTELAGMDANIAESNQFWDRQTNRFFMRIAFTAAEGTTKDDVERVLKPAIQRFDMKTTLVDQSKKPKIIIMVSKFDHALLHLIYQIKVGWLDA
ncbi:ACT domain-containing protein, partial [Phyllobacterium zundukense]